MYVYISTVDRVCVLCRKESHIHVLTCTYTYSYASHTYSHAHTHTHTHIHILTRTYISTADDKLLGLTNEFFLNANMIVRTYRKEQHTHTYIHTYIHAYSHCHTHPQEIKSVDRAVKNWPAYKGLEDAVKNMQTSLPLVQELHHPAMRERHWKQLMRTTGMSLLSACVCA